MKPTRRLFNVAFTTLVPLLSWAAATPVLAARAKRPSVYDPAKAYVQGSTESKRVGGIVKFGQDVDIRPDDAVNGAVFLINGSATIEGTVDGPIVTVGGSVGLKPGCSVFGPVVSIGGHTVVDPGAQIEGPVVELPRSFVPWRMLGLTLGPMVGILGSYWLVYKIFNTLGWIALSLMLWLLFPKALAASRDALKTQLGWAALAGLLFWPSLGIVSIIFLVSLVGIPLLPIVALGAACAWFWGFTTLGYYLGERIAERGYWRETVLSVLIGTTLLRMLEWLPILGFLVYLAVGVLGVGISLISRFGTRSAS